MKGIAYRSNIRKWCKWRVWIISISEGKPVELLATWIINIYMHDLKLLVRGKEVQLQYGHTWWKVHKYEGLKCELKVIPQIFLEELPDRFTDRELSVAGREFQIKGIWQRKEFLWMEDLLRQWLSFGKVPEQVLQVQNDNQCMRGKP